MLSLRPAPPSLFLTATCLIACCAAPAVLAQDVLLEDDFEGGNLLSKWSGVEGLDPGCRHLAEGWELGSPAPADHVEGGSALIDGLHHVISGFDLVNSQDQHSSARIDVYDPAADEWLTATEPLPDMPTTVNHIQVALDDPHVWIAGGFGAVEGNGFLATDEVWRWDSSTGEWVNGPALPSARASGGFARLGRRLHYVGGIAPDRTTNLGEHWTLDLDAPLESVEWQAAAALPMARNHFQVVALGGLLYAVGGQFGHDGFTEDTALLHVYDPVTNAWQRLADLPHERSHAEPAIFAYAGRLFVVGGRDNNAFVDGESADELRTVQSYDPILDLWHETGTLPVPLISPWSAAADGLIWVMLGGVHWDEPQRNTWRAPLRLVCD